MKKTMPWPRVKYEKVMRVELEGLPSIDAYEAGAAVAFGLMGMAEAIRRRAERQRFAAETERFLDDHAGLMRRLGDG